MGMPAATLDRRPLRESSTARQRSGTKLRQWRARRRCPGPALGGHDVAGGHHVEAVQGAGAERRLEQARHVRSARRRRDREADADGLRFVEQAGDPRPQRHLAGRDQAGVALRLAGVQAGDGGRVQPGDGAKGVNEVADALLAARDLEQAGVERAVPRPGETGLGEGLVERPAVRLLGLREGAVDVEDRASGGGWRLTRSAAPATPRSPRHSRAGRRWRSRRPARRPRRRSPAARSRA